ncbi:MAG: DNA repair protein RecN [Lachnospiraceae bacterium]|nr:DNA repair protein RecN [Lachnospiraceae bacterium]
MALIEEEEVEFGQGMNVLTGETGAGKSILIGSILLALGGKADKDFIRRGADHALIELGFKIDREAQRRLCQELEIPLEDDSLVLSRRISQGKNVSRANGELISIKQAKILADSLIDIHGQREHMSLLKKEKLRDLLDSYCGEKAEKPLASLKEKLPELKKLKKELETAELDEAKRQRELDFARFSAEEIKRAGIKENEEEALAAAFRKMDNAWKIREGIAQVMNMLDSDGGVLEALARMQRELSGIQNFDPALEGLASQLGDGEGILEDFRRNLDVYVSENEFSEEEYMETEERLSLVQGILMKYGGSFGKVQEYLAEQEALIRKYEDFDAYLADLRQNISKAEKKVLEACKALSAARKKAAGELTPKLVSALQSLNFLDVRFEISICFDEKMLTEEGADAVDFLISLNPGEPLRLLSEVASGGEVSRIMLGLKSVFADKDDIPTLVFDEIDTGISGKTAWRVSEQMGELGKNRQIICITHLPQIAAMGDVHFYIEKSTDGKETMTAIRRLAQEERPGELARMFGGDGDASLQSAREMLEEALKYKEKTGRSQ